MNVPTIDELLNYDERNELMDEVFDNFLPDFKQVGEDDVWYGRQIGDRMFDLQLWIDEDTGETICTVHECDWDASQNNWKTNFGRTDTIIVEEILRCRQVIKMQHMQHLEEEIKTLKSRLQPHDTGHISTAISVLQNRVEEIRQELTK